MKCIGNECVVLERIEDLVDLRAADASEGRPFLPKLWKKHLEP